MRKRKRKTKLQELQEHIDEALEHKENSWLKVMEIVGDIAKDVIRLRADNVNLQERVTKLERGKNECIN